MKSKFVIIVIIVATIIGVYFYIQKSPVQAPVIQENVQPSSIEEVSKITVNYTDKGFIPPLIEIQKGQTVQFVNQSAGGMWIGSGPHPTHTEYPEFDAKKNFPNGGIYEFTFNKVGSWSYHNHIGSEKTGMIIVK